MNKKITIDIPAQMAKVIVIVGEPKYLQREAKKLGPGYEDEVEQVHSDPCVTALTTSGYPMLVTINSEHEDFNLLRSLTHEMVHCADCILYSRKVEFQHLNEIYPHMIGYLVSESMRLLKESK